MQATRIDVAVIGGGPAGCATALALARWGTSVMVLERSNYSNQRIGETLPPAIQKLLRNLGVWERFLADAHSPSFGTESAWGRGRLRANDFIFSPYGPGWHIDRARFDATLACAAEDAGAAVYRDTRLTGCEQDDGGTWRIEAVHDNRRRHFRANFLVDATGRTASLARKNGARRMACDRLIGIVGFLVPCSEAPSPARDTLVEAVANGWWYSAVLPDRRLVLAYMTDADLCARGRDHLTGAWLRGLEMARHTRSRTQSYALPSKLRSFAANSSRLNVTAGKSWLAVGDAAMAFDPLSSQGVYKAIESGVGAAQAIRENGIGNLTAVHEFEAGVERSFNQYLLTRAAFYASEQRWPNSPFWRRRHSLHRFEGVPKYLELLSMHPSGAT